MPRTKGAKTKNKPGHRPGPRFTLTDRERVKHAIQQYDLKGYSQTAIAAMPDIKCSQGLVSTLLKEIQKDYQDAYVDNRKMWVMKATHAHLDVIREAQEAIAKLKTVGKKRSKTESGVGGKGEFSKDVEETEDGEIGGFLTIIQNGWKEIASLHGLRELPEQVFNLNVTQNTVGMFDQFVLEMIKGQPQPERVVAVPTPGEPSTTSGAIGE